TPSRHSSQPRGARTIAGTSVYHRSLGGPTRKGWLMKRVREQVKAERSSGGRSHAVLALTGLALVGLAVLGLVPHANAARDPSASAFLEGALRPQMQATLRKSIPGLAITEVTCYVPQSSKAISGPCTARFTIPKYQLKGTYKAKATLDSKSRLTWST